ncbi:hypothetical protein BG006_002182 [Podila minutissima]|uniref:Uncharacterized protein n=1 Tax=Podila minutissima TaxID=64525 RepID=A0A9P5SSK7_9FUNG|nr:hypothetical protein BG006_002182 [Podila minutissima]
MTAALSLSEYQERTYIKQFGDFTFFCDRSQLSAGESALSAAEEAEALQLLDQTMTLLKKYLFFFGMRWSNPLFVDTKSGKRDARLDEEDRIKEEAEKKEEEEE